MPAGDDRVPIELLLEEQMHASIAEITGSQRVVLVEDVLDTETPVDGIPVLLIAQIGRCRGEQLSDRWSRAVNGRTPPITRKSGRMPCSRWIYG